MNLADAFNSLAKSLLYCIGDENWDYATSVIAILPGMTSSGYSWYYEGKRYGYFDGIGYLNGNEVPLDLLLEESDACFFLQSDLMQRTGDRIWGLTFTLYPTGKFEIDYDYNKPEDYDDSDETITGEEINQSLYDLGLRTAPTGNDPKGNE